MKKNIRILLVALLLALLCVGVGSAANEILLVGKGNAICAFDTNVDGNTLYHFTEIHSESEYFTFSILSRPKNINGYGIDTVPFFLGNSIVMESIEIQIVRIDASGQWVLHGLPMFQSSSSISGRCFDPPNLHQSVPEFKEGMDINDFGWIMQAGGYL